ncbi:peptidase M17 [Modestobacter sp. I12A-02628]|uniref:Probable cytosol aminopeptidase n=1 Tax=Goekera deserti TaxID=2497753 RepID=A0A7K3WCA1_9ACTN|nr:peptidase M17 [Goekera deserti]NDI48352.1 peptidase M17 [Goekera deserti]NEL54101.1 peptidase M17 [Goekera deserti]
MPVGAAGALPTWFAAHGPVDAGFLAGALADTGNGGKPGGITNVPVPGRRPRSLVAVGVGDATLPHLRSATGVAVRRGQTLAEHGARRLVLPVDSRAGADGVRAVVEAALLAGYRFRHTSTPHPPRLAEVLVVTACAGEPQVVAAAQAGRVTAGSVAWARDLVNTPGSTKDPGWVAERVHERLTAEHVQVTVLGAGDLAAGGFGGVLAVGGASASPPCVVVARYDPPGAGAGHPVLVGAGTTFDTGGISIATTAVMRHAHTDVAGAAAVLAAVDAASRLRLPVRVTAVVPLVENHVGAGGYRPGDVVRHVGGRTTEVRRTDAEGRLLLADALAWARLELGASVLVDVGTLTRAVSTALGSRTAGLYAGTDGLAGALQAAASHTGERLWRMPLTEEHVGHLRAQLHSDVADANNAPGDPGATTAALFLQPFAGDLPWAHLDVAGPARAAADDAEVVKGGSGFATRTLLRWLEAGAPTDAEVAVA